MSALDPGSCPHDWEGQPHLSDRSTQRYKCRLCRCYAYRLFSRRSGLGPILVLRTKVKKKGVATYQYVVEPRATWLTSGVPASVSVERHRLAVDVREAGRAMSEVTYGARLSKPEKL